MSLPANSYCEERVSLHFTQSGFLIPTPAGVVVEKGPSTYWPTLGRVNWTDTPWGGVGRGLVWFPVSFFQCFATTQLACQ